MIALLRLVELDSGKVLFDGVDARTVGLAALRSKIAVIPQDPVLFSGTIRSNLDPFGEFSNTVLYEVLHRVGLHYAASAGDGRSYSSASLSSMVATSQIQSLEDGVSEGGINFSVGQRQLVVIARALLCGAFIVIMDEATAAVDAGTIYQKDLVVSMGILFYLTKLYFFSVHSSFIQTLTRVFRMSCEQNLSTRPASRWRTGSTPSWTVITSLSWTMGEQLNSTHPKCCSRSRMVCSGSSWMPVPARGLEIAVLVAIAMNPAT